MVGSYRVALRQVNENEFKHVGRLDLQESDWKQLVDVTSYTPITVKTLDRLMSTLIRSDRFDGVRMRARDLREHYGESWLLCRGHDLTQLLSLKLSDFCRRRIHQKDIERSLRLACTNESLDKTPFGKRLRMSVRSAVKF